MIPQDLFFRYPCGIHVFLLLSLLEGIGLWMHMLVVSPVILPMYASDGFVGIHGATKEKGMFV